MSIPHDKERLSSRSSQTDIQDLEKGEVAEHEPTVDQEVQHHHLLHHPHLTNKPGPRRTHTRRRTRRRSRKTPLPQIHQKGRFASRKVPIDRSRQGPRRLGFPRRSSQPAQLPSAEQGFHYGLCGVDYVSLAFGVIYFCAGYSVCERGF